MERKRTSLAAQASGPRTFSPKSKSSKVSTVPAPATDSAKLEDSIAKGTKRHTPAKSASIRKRMNIQRDSRTALGAGKSTSVVTE